MYVGSRCCESTSTFTCGCVRRISAAATRPSSALPGGMRTSTIATSGTTARTCARTSGASRARPTTSWPASLSSAARPSRSSASSSATMTRSFLPAGEATGSAGVGSPEAMSKDAVNRGPVADVRDLRRVEHAVARILAQSDRPVEVYEATLEIIGTELGWQLGGVWEIEPLDGRLRCVVTWHAGARADEFQALSAEIALAPNQG